MRVRVVALFYDPVVSTVLPVVALVAPIGHLFGHADGSSVVYVNARTGGDDDKHRVLEARVAGRSGAPWHHAETQSMTPDPETPMPTTIDYYFAAQSPWTFLGHARFVRLAHEAGATVRVLPADFGQVFPVSGGLPLAQRAQQRQAYRLVDLRRFSDLLDMPMNVQPKFFPVHPDAASKLIIAVEQADGSAAALDIAGRVFRACWQQQRDIADAATLASLLTDAGLPAVRLAESQQPAAAERYANNTAAAIAAGVFGAPSYLIDGEVFWGQDRLDFVARRLGIDRQSTSRSNDRPDERDLREPG